MNFSGSGILSVINCTYDFVNIPRFISIFSNFKHKALICYIFFSFKKHFYGIIHVETVLLSSENPFFCILRVCQGSFEFTLIGDHQDHQKTLKTNSKNLLFKNYFIYHSRNAFKRHFHENFNYFEGKTFFFDNFEKAKHFNGIKSVGRKAEAVSKEFEDGFQAKPRKNNSSIGMTPL